MDPAPSDTLFDDFAPVSAEAWERKIMADLRGKPYDDTLLWTTPDRMVLRPFYRRDDLDDLPRQPITKTEPGNPWHLRQDVAVHTVLEANDAARTALDGGADALGFDLSPIALDTDALARVLEGLDLSATPLHFTNAPASLVRQLLDVAARQGIDAGTLRGSVASDLSVADALALAEQAPHLRTLVRSLSGETPAQRLGDALAQTTDVLADPALGSAALGCRLLHLTVDVGTSYFMEIATLRALRRLLDTLVCAFDPDADAARHIHVHATTRAALSADGDAETNLLRGTTAAASAILGGCDSLTVAPFDLLTGGPTPFSLRLARNTQLILKHEAHLDRVADPAAGAYYIDVLTDRLAHAAWALFQEHATALHPAS